MGDLSGNNLVEKSKALVWAKFRDYTAGELRLLEVYLSRINPRDPESATVRFTLKEYCEFLGIRLNSKDLKAQLTHFIENTVAIPLEGKDEYTLYTLFAMAQIKFEPESFTYVVSIRCNPLLQPVFFDIAEKGYVRYRLRYTASMKSQYSILLYSMFRDWINMGGKEHEISMKSLKEQLGASAKSYDQFKFFRVKVLDPSVNEINEISDVEASYTKRVLGHKVVSIVFSVKLKHSEPVIDAESSEIDTIPLRDVPAEQKPVKKPRSGAYEDVEWAKIAPELDKTECIGIAKMVAKRIRQEHPLVKTSKRKAAVSDVIKNSYDAVLKNREPWPDNPAGYLYSVLNQDGVIANYLPYTYEI